jgi:hypothetical protein
MSAKRQLPAAKRQRIAIEIPEARAMSQKSGNSEAVTSGGSPELNYIPKNMRRFSVCMSTPTVKSTASRPDDMLSNRIDNLCLNAGRQPCSICHRSSVPSQWPLRCL